MTVKNRTSRGKPTEKASIESLPLKEMIIKLEDMLHNMVPILEFSNDKMVGKKTKFFHCHFKGKKLNSCLQFSTV